MSDISCKKILKNEKDIIIFDDNDFRHEIFEIICILMILFTFITITSSPPETPENKNVGWFGLFLGTAFYIIVGLSLIISKKETITLDKKLKSVYIQSRRLFVLKGKDRTIGFSEILYPSIKENTGDGVETLSSWDIILTLKSGEIKQIFRGENHEEAEALLDRIFNFLDISDKSIVLNGSPS